MPSVTAAPRAQDEIETEVFTVRLEPTVRPSLVDTWVRTLQAAEMMHMCLHPSYVRHTEEELVALVERALREHRGPSRMVDEMLSQGRRSLAQQFA